MTRAGIITALLFAACGQRGGSWGTSPRCVGSQCDSQLLTCNSNSNCVAAACIGGYCTPLSDAGGPCDEHNDCTVGLACIDAVCRVAAGPCTTNAECDGAVCIGGRCSERSTTDGPCDETGDCIEGHACHAAACKALEPNGAACVDDRLCNSGECECTDATCSARVCAASSCVCRYGAAGSCTSNLEDGVDDPGDCSSAGVSCYAGSCVPDNQRGSCSCSCNPTGCVAILSDDSCGPSYAPTACSCSLDLYGVCQPTSLCTCQ